MTKNQLRRLLLRVPNVVKFCQKHNLSRRTTMRLRTHFEGEPTKRTYARYVAALIQEGIIESGDQQRKPARGGGNVSGRKRA